MKLKLDINIFFYVPRFNAEIIHNINILWPSSVAIYLLLAAFITLCAYCLHQDGRFGSKLGQIGPKWDKSGAFSDQISVHLAISDVSSKQRA